MPEGDTIHSAARRIRAALVLDQSRFRIGSGIEHVEIFDSGNNKLKTEVRKRWPPGTRLDVAGFKDLTGLSRKFVIPLLEYLDRERVTRRSGNERLVLM